MPRLCKVAVKSWWRGVKQKYEVRAALQEARKGKWRENPCSLAGHRGV